MTLRAMALAALLGVAVPTGIAELVAPQAAIAQPVLDGDFMNNDWVVSVWYEGGSYRYQGTDRSSGSNLRLAGATLSGDSSRQVYTWNNSGYLYQVSWRPSDPHVVRLQVFHPNGRELVNSLLDRIFSSP
jgi:hypothetical protein